VFKSKFFAVSLKLAQEIITKTVLKLCEVRVSFIYVSQLNDIEYNSYLEISLLT
jgi:hypothetical protein